MSSEVCFPRGPVARFPTKTVDFKKRNEGETLFKLKGKTIKKKKSTDIRKNKHSTNEAWNVENGGKIESLFKTDTPKNIYDLRYKSVTEGLVIAGRIREITSSRVGVSLPGRLLAHATVDMISKPYTDQLQSLSKNLVQSEDVARLEDLFQIGELVTVAVDTVNEINGKYCVSVSFNPSDVNKHLNQSTLAENIVLVGAIKSKEDHGFMVDLGIKSVTAFLPKKNVSGDMNEGINKLEIGKVVRAVITKVTRTSTKTTVVLSLKSEAITSAVPENGFSTTNLLPGNQLKVSVIKVLHNGLVVKPFKMSEDVTGHVTMNHLPDSWSKISNFKTGRTLPATLLYTVQHVNVMYFSLKPQIHDSNPQRHFHDGCLVKNSKVAALGGEGVYFALGSGELNAKGLVSYPQTGGKTVFNVGDEHTLRIIQYDFMADLYICSLKPEIVSIEVYSVNDLQIGQSIEGTVDKVIEGKGLSLKVGNITVFAPQAHLSDFPQNTKKFLLTLYKPNSLVKAKVLFKSEDNCIVTLKPMLISSPALASYSDARIGSCFHGTVNAIIDNGVKVLFYNKITGFIPNSQISSETTGIEKQALQLGQTVRCYVIAVDPVQGRLILSLIPKLEDKKFEIGTSHALTVIDVLPEGLKVKISSANLDGFIPIHQLSDHVTLVELLKDYYTAGREIKSAVLYSTNENFVPLFTLRNSVIKFLEEKPGVTTENLALKRHVIVPCAVLEVLENGLKVDICIPKSKEHFIPSKDILGYDKDDLSSLSVNQAVMAVSSASKSGLKFKLEKSKFFNITELGLGLDMLQDYLNSSKNLQNVFSGEKLEATISKIKKKTVKINLPVNSTEGVINRAFCKKDLEVNNSIEVIVLWQSPLNKCVHSLPAEELMEESTTKSTGRFVPAKVVLVEQDFAVGIIQDGPLKSHITLLPFKSHLNDFIPKKLLLSATVQVIPVFVNKNCILSIDKAKLVEHSERTWQKMKKIQSELLMPDNEVFKGCHSIKDYINLISKRPEESLQNGTVIENNKSVEKKKNKKSLESFSNGMDITADKVSKKKKMLSEKQPHTNEIPKDKSTKKKKSEIGSDEQLNELFESSPFTDEVDDSELNSSLKSLKKRKTDNSSSNEATPKKKKKSIESTLEIEETVDNVEIVKKKKKSIDKKSINSENVNHILEDSVSSSNSERKGKKMKESKLECNGISIEDDSSINSENKKKKKKSNTCSEDSDQNNKEESEDGIKSRLSLNGYESFSWSVNAKDFSSVQGGNDIESEDDDDDDVDNLDKKGKKQMTASEKRAAAKESEMKLRRAEQLLLEAESNPQSVDHFERLVLAHPNSSMLWIKYMAMHLQETEIDKARTIAKRALQVINPREEEERLNVWTALLNLENLYGTEESLKSTLAEAIRTNDDYQVYSKMLEIYADSNKAKDVEHLTGMMAKKFKSKLECWLLCCRSLMRVGSLERSRSFFQRGLEALTKKDHVQFITRFALLENALGSFDHAQTVMDHVLMTYPGRIPAWTTYVDMLTKSGSIDLARQVLERSVAQKLPVKKMKTLYKKWLDFEKQHGTETNISHVKAMAEKYGNSLNAKIDEL